MNTQKMIIPIEDRQQTSYSSGCKKIIVVLVLFSVGFINSMAQPTLQYQNFTQKDGLASDFVICILQDSYGFMWIGGENGLNRFDGKHFLRFNFDSEEPESLDDYWVNLLYEDSQRNLWICTLSGLHRLNRETGKIERIPLFRSGQTVEDVSLPKVWEDQLGNIWVSSGEGDLYKLIKSLGKTQNWQADYFTSHPPSFKLGSSEPPPADLFHATSAYLWLHTKKDIFRIHIPTKSIRQFTQDSTDAPKGYSIGSIYRAYENNGQLFFLTQQGLFSLAPNTESVQFQLIKSFDATANNEPLFWGRYQNAPQRFFQDGLHTFLVGLKRKTGLFNGKTGALDWFSSPSGSTDNLFPDNISSVYKDQQGNYWIGTQGSGVFIGRQSNKAFSFYPLAPNSLPNGQVRSMLEDDSGKLWISFLNYGLGQFTLDQDLGLQKRLEVVPSTGSLHTLADDRAVQIMEGAEGSIWLATLTQGLVRMNSTGTEFRTFSHQQGDSTSLSANRIWGIARDKEGHIWAGAWDDGLNRLDPRTGLVKRFRHDPNTSNSLGSDNIRCLYFDQQGILWIGTNQGLGRYDPKAAQFTHFRHDPDDAHSLSNDLVWSIFEDQKGQLWVGTNMGLNLYDPVTQKSQHFFESAGLPDNTIYGILEDDEGRLWISTKNGLARTLRTDPGKVFQSIGSANGLETVSFLPKAYLNSAYSEALFFGGTDGLVIVKPSLIGQNTTLPHFALHAMATYRRKAGFVEEYTDFFLEDNTEPVRLGYQDQSISFTIADLNWLSNKSFKYEYQLAGLSKQWFPLTEDMQVRFTNLQPGTYRLRTRAVNLENISLPASELLSLKVFPPWWKSWWAYMIYFLMSGGFILFFVLSYLRRQLVKKEVEGLRALDEFKNKLFTNITHEFRTPLTVISGMNEQIKKKPDRWLEEGSGLIRKNTDSLLDLINQILELQKAESGKLKVEMQQADIIPLLRNIFDQFQAYAQSKEQQLAFISEVDKLNMDHDPEKILRIVSNLLSNAVKYTPEHGKVILQVSSGTNPVLKADQCLSLTVKDNGPGIPQDQLPYIFNRFFQTSASNQTVGTGVGLSLTRELVKLLGGDISVDSQAGQGTTFKVYLPVTQEASLKQTAAPINIKKAIFGRAEQLKIAEGAGGEDLPLALIVEDNPDIALYLQVCLEGSYRLEVAPDGQAGIYRALEIIPDIIISDVMMPKKDGFELCETLKDDIRTSHIPIILLTAKSDVESRIQGLKHGADHYLAKPFHEEELLIRMQNLLEIRRKLHLRYKNLAEDLNLIPQAETPSKEDQFILQLKTIVETRLDDTEFNLDDLSKALFLSRSQLGRKVKALTGSSPGIYIRSLRLHKAQELLFNTSLPVKEISFEVGFSDPPYFTRCYIEEFGETPTNTREKV